MTDNEATHLIRDLPPTVKTPDLPGAGGPPAEHPAVAERRGQTRPAGRTADTGPGPDRS